MWPFQGSKHSKQSTKENVEKYLEVDNIDETFRMSPVRTKALKKTLFFGASENCDDQEFDIFTVCWDVKQLTEPPDDIAPLLPPASWGEPDIICIGLQNCPDECAASWSVVFSQSITSYSRSYAPLSSEAPYDPRSGSLLLVFVRSELHHFVHSYAHEDKEVAAVRFGFHHSSVCIIVAPSLNMDINNDDVSKEAKFHQTLWHEALKKQRFRSLSAGITFAGAAPALDNHPLIIWLGLKDEKLKTEREMSKYNPNELLDEVNCKDMGRLVDHNVDVRFRSKTLMPFDAAPMSFAFATSEGSITQHNPGNLTVMKAGTLRLVLEMLNDDGLPVPSESLSELVLLRLTIPIVNIEKLKSLYRHTWTVLKDAPSDEYPSITVDKPQVQFPEPLRPWCPALFKFKVRNVCKWGLPASFSLHCVSDSVKHSFYYNKMQIKPIPKEVVTKAKGRQKTALPSDVMTRIPASQLKGLNSRLSSRTLLSGSMTARAGFSTGLLSRVLGGTKRNKSGAKTARTTRQASVESLKSEEEELFETETSPLSSTVEYNTQSPRNHSTTASSPPISPRKLAPAYSLTKWITASPTEGVVNVGKDVEVAVSIMLMEGVSAACQCEPLTLVVRIDDCRRDVFVSLDPKVRPSIFGLSYTDLLRFGSEPLIAPNGPLNISERSSSASSTCDGLALPLPKEIWNILKFIHYSLIRSLDPSHPTLPSCWRDTSMLKVPPRWFCLPVMLKDAAFSWTEAHPSVQEEMELVTDAVERNQQIPPCCSIEAALRVLEKWFLATPLPFVPRESLVNAEEEDGGMHMVCRAILLNLTTGARNIMIAVLSIMRELIVYNEYTWEAMTAFLRSKDPECLHCADLLPSTVTPFRVLSDEVRASVLSKLLNPKGPYKSPCDPVVVSCMAEWIGRFMAEDSPPHIRKFFISHFLQ